MNKSKDLFSLSTNPSFIQKLPPDFEIIVAGVPVTRYKVHLCVAASFSLTIRTWSLCDPVKRFFEYPEPDNRGFFQLIIDFMYGKDITLTPENARFLNMAAAYLENPELLDLTAKYLMQFGMEQDCLKRLVNAPKVSVVIPEITLVSHNFDNLKSLDDMKKLPIYIYDAILGMIDLNIENEKSFFQWINNLVEARGPEFAQLFAHLRIEDLDPASVRLLKSRLTPDMIGGALWKALCKRLLYRTTTEEPPTKRKVYPPPPKANHSAQNVQQNQVSQGQMYAQQSNITQYHQEQPKQANSINRFKHYPYKPGHPFNGIFAALRDLHDKNPCSAGLVAMDGGGGPKARFLPKLLDYSNLDAWWNNYNGNGFNKNDQWITIHFKRHEVVLSDYTLSSPMQYPDSCQPKSWRVYGSNDTVNWELIDEVFNSQKMNKKHPTEVFSIKSQNQKGPFTWFKIEQLQNQKKVSTNDQNQFCLNGLEFYGYIADI